MGIREFINNKYIIVLKYHITFIMCHGQKVFDSYVILTYYVLHFVETTLLVFYFNATVINRYVE